MAYEYLYNNLDVQAPLMPGMHVTRGGSVSGDVVVPNSGGKTVTEIMNEIAHPKPGNYSGVPAALANAGKDASVMAEPGYRQSDLASLIEDAWEYYNRKKTEEPNDDPEPTPTSAKEFAGNPFNPVIDYLNADIAQHYGMSKETAYQEALSNTAYQRAILDMQKAGLNPATIFGAGRGSGSGGVSYVSGHSAQSFGSNPDSVATNGLLADTSFMESIGALFSVILGKSASSGKATGKAISVIAQKLDSLSK